MAKAQRRPSTKKAIKSKTKYKSESLTGCVKDDNELLQLIIDNITYLVFWKDKKLKFLGCNQRFADVLGLDDPEDIIGKTDSDILTDKEDIKTFREVDRKVMKTGLPVSYKMKAIDKKDEWLEITKLPLRDRAKNVIGVIGILRDITAQIKIEKKIVANGEKYRNLIESTQTAYAILNMSMQIIETNDIFNELLGIDYENLKGRAFRHLVASQDIIVFDEAVEKLLKGSLINNVEIMLRSPKKKLLAVCLSANVVENGENKIICLLRDASRKKKDDIKRYIEEQKKKDRLKQNITALRGVFKQIQKKERDM